MKRRKFLAGVCSISAGAGGLLSTQAHRNNSHLSFGPCTNSGGDTLPNAAYVRKIDGTYAVDLSPDNDQVLGDGVNTRAVTTFHNVFQLCNEGDQSLCVDMRIGEGDDDVPTIPSDANVPAGYDFGPGDPAVVFYRGADEDARIEMASLDPESRDAISLEPGDCQCIGFTVRAFGFDAGTDIFEDTEVLIEANVGTGCVDVQKESAWGILESDTEIADTTDRRLETLSRIRKWGWYIPYEIGTGPVDAEFWAAAGNNRLNNGAKAGTISITDGSESLVVDIDTPAATLVETSLFVGRTTSQLSDIRAAPGRFEYDNTSSEYDEAESRYTIHLDEMTDVPEKGDQLILAIHGVVEL